MAGLLTACNRDGAAAQTKAPTVDAVPVEVALAAHSAISASYSGTAALVADHEAQVTAKTSGVLKKLYVEEGMTVKAGQLLAELDDADALAKSKQAEAQMHKAEATFTHAQAAIPKHLIPEYEYEQDKFDLAAQRAAYEAANIQLSYTRIVAPVDGVIAERSIKLGNLVQANQNLFRIVGMNPLQAVLNVPERQLGILKAGQAVQLEADALPGKKFAGSILRIAPVVDPASGTFRVTCQFRDASSILRPGHVRAHRYRLRPACRRLDRAALGIGGGGWPDVGVRGRQGAARACAEARSRQTRRKGTGCRPKRLRCPSPVGEDRLYRRRQGGDHFGIGCRRTRHHGRPQRRA